MTGMRHRYVDTQAGQLHVSEAGAGPTVLLLHWVPLSGRMYEDELPVLAGLGYRAIAADLIGFGRSARAEPRLGFDAHARVLAEAMAGLGVDRYAVLGAHYSAPVACELALDDGGVRALLIDGAAHLLPGEAARGLGARVARLPGPGLHEDGSHRTFLWDQAANALGIFDPDFVPRPDNVHLVYRLILDYLSTGMPADFGGFAPYDMAGRLGEIEVPVCVLSAERDPLLPAYAPTLAAAAAAGATGRVIPGAHPLHVPARVGEYAREIAGWLDTVVDQDEGDAK
jgi:pimeloyl-ACP methyl ester carboxylesterase